jgi:phospholipid/cholesterol/gamma-HCH transport system substrate-binding protein
MRKGTQRLIGALAILGGVVIFVIGVTRPDPFQETHTYYAEFDSAQGLGSIGRDIRVAGVNVGTMGSVEREGDNAVVELTLEEDIPMHTDARVDMRPHTLFEGSSFVDLRPGSPSAPTLEEGERIPIEQTSNYVTLDEALRVLRPEIRESLRELAALGSETLQGEAIEGIQRTLKGGPELTRHLKAPVRAFQGTNRSELARAISGAAETFEAVATKEEELIPLAQRLNRTAAALTVDGGVPLDAALAELPGALSQLRTTAPVLTGLVDRVDRLSVEAIPALAPLTVAVRNATPLVARSIPLLRDATPLISQQRKITRRISATAAPLTKLILGEGRDVAEVFGESILPVLLADGIHGEPTYKQVAQLFTAADAVFRPYQTAAQNPLGHGHVWNQAVYFDPEAVTGLLETLAEGGIPLPLSSEDAAAAAAEGVVRCETIAQVSPSAARTFERAKGCL